jgi:hypothetical protein
MDYRTRGCAGVKACEHLADELKVSHTEVDLDSYKWADMLAEQHRAEENSLDATVEVLLDEWKNHRCRKLMYGNTSCGGEIIIGSRKPGKDRTAYTRLFIGCSRFQGIRRSDERRMDWHTFVPLDGYDPIRVLQVFGQTRCKVHSDLLDELGFQWNQQGAILLILKLIIGVSSNTAKCYAIYANKQGGNDKQCNFYHSGIAGESERKRGKIIQLECDVKFHIFTPQFKDGVPTTKNMAIVCYGEHTHPPPPPRKIDAKVKQKLINLIQTYGAPEATARRLVAPPILPIMLGGEIQDLGEMHVGLLNQDVVNHIIRKERIKSHPWGTDFQGNSLCDKLT